jgi:hypothetical protein
MSLVQVKLFPVVPTERTKALVINCELGFDSNAAVTVRVCSWQIVLI